MVLRMQVKSRQGYFLLLSFSSSKVLFMIYLITNQSILMKKTLFRGGSVISWTISTFFPFTLNKTTLMGFFRSCTRGWRSSPATCATRGTRPRSTWSITWRRSTGRSSFSSAPSAKTSSTRGNTWWPTSPKFIRLKKEWPMPKKRRPWNREKKWWVIQTFFNSVISWKMLNCAKSLEEMFTQL